MRIKKALRQLSRAIASAIVFCSATVGFSGCGLLGKKDAKSKSTKLNQNTGCLDQLGPIFKLYLRGEISAPEWTGTWDCVDDTLETLSRYVRGSEADSYTRDEIRSLVAQFILTAKPITPELMDGMFAIKSTFFGGGADRLTKSELASFRSLARFVKERSVVLIPMLNNYHHAKTRANLDELTRALTDFTAAFSDRLAIEGNAPLEKAKLTTFIVEMSKNSLDFDLEDVHSIIDLALGVKSLLLTGEPTVVTGGELKELFRVGGSLGAQFIGLASDTAGADGPALNRAVDVVGRHLLDAVERWNGKIPFNAIEGLLVSVPKSMLPRRAEDFREASLKLLHPRVVVDGNGANPRRVQSAFATLLKNLAPERDGGIYAENVSELIGQFRLVARGDRSVAQIFEGVPAGKEFSAVEIAARVKALAAAGSFDYPDRGELDRLSRLAGTFPGMFADGSQTMRFDGVVTHSRTSLARLNWMERAARRLIEAYGSAATPPSASYPRGEPLGTIDDLQHLVDDVNDLLIAASLSHPKAVGVAAKRFREANLFMSVSNGDAYLDIAEVTEYINTLVASANLGSSMSRLFFGDEDARIAGLCPRVGFDDDLQLPTYDLQCFRREYRERFAENFRDFPQLLDTFVRASGDDQNLFFETIETAAKYGGISDAPITSYDLSGYAGIAHYVETVFYHFDRNGGPDRSLDRTETVGQVYPIFERELMGLTKKDTKLINQSILLYLMQRGRSPVVCANKISAKEILDLTGWALGGGLFNDFNADRMRVYSIFGALGAVGGPACQ